MPGTWSPDAWRAAKGAFVTSIEQSPSGAPLGNPATPVGAASFTALVALDGGGARLGYGRRSAGSPGGGADGCARCRWDDRRRTWVDDGPTATGTGAAPTLEALLPLLVSTSETACEVTFVDLCDPAACGAALPARASRRDHPAYEPLGYWRGGTWPQLAYLVWVAARRRGRGDVAAAIASSMCRAADRSGSPEYWHPETAAPGGAVPQSWTALAAVVAAPPDHSGR